VIYYDVAQISWKPKSHLEVLGARRVGANSKVHADDAQTSEATLLSFAPRAT